jgi:hypothetical protein
MKKLTLGLFNVLFLAFSSVGLATTKADDSKKMDATTAHQFEDLLVQGKYHFSDEAVTTVEEDKVLDALIGVRSDFKDRMKKSTARR